MTDPINAAIETVTGKFRFIIFTPIDKYRQKLLRSVVSRLGVEPRTLALKGLIELLRLSVPKND